MYAIPELVGISPTNDQNATSARFGQWGPRPSVQVKPPINDDRAAGGVPAATKSIHFFDQENQNGQ